ncbi:alpha-amylase [Sphingomonas sp. RHCKR7]|uniref:alpha-amylase family glycosyl hydrolase n=1 Tax=Sphingomonas folli TaxID=2862497 RepID=UPI001CA55862|nr:alpha-amylase family glycosyl hydrolase [Sphingomonas folli]MBW6526271.1 alpha-amylase [Sphingomonas folli]
MTMEERLAAIGPRLRRQLDRLYGQHGGAGALWARTETLLRERFAERHAALRALDEARLADPDWFVRPDMLGYSTYVDRYAGTVAGLAARVDHLESLGVRYLHLLALLKAREGDSDGGFAVADYLAVEPRLGTIDEVEALTARLRAARISLCVDLALNHTADDHLWAKAARAGDPFYRDFYITVDAAEAAARDAELPQVFPATAPGNFTHVPAMGGHVWTTFYPFQWDLNWRNPDVFLAILDVALRLANRGVEAFRLDSIAFLWKRPGSDCRNLPQTHYIVRALRAALDIAAPATLLKAEAIVPTAFVPPYFGLDEGEGFEPECHLVYNNSLMVAGWVGLAEQSAALPAAIVAASGGLPTGANWLSYARCHDDIGWGSVLGDLRAIDAAPERRLAAAARFLEGVDGGWARGAPFQGDGAVLHGSNGTMASLAGLESARGEEEREAAYRRIALLNALAIASGGLATTYMGDELGLLNDYAYRDDPERAHEGRWLHRPAMDWAALDDIAARRISGDLRALRAARVASGGAGAPVLVETGAASLLGVACGHDRVFLNFGAAPAALPAAGLDRLTGAACDTAPAWGVVWLEGPR